MSAARLKINVLANLAGGAWTSILSILFVPLYIRYLGIEAYGLIGFHGVLMAIFSLLDLGLGTTLNRGLARLSVHDDRLAEQRDLLRTLELIYWTLSLSMGLLIFAAAGPIATKWVHAQHLPAPTIRTAVSLMGVVSALQFPFALYQAGLMGLQRQVLVNAIVGGLGTVRALGAVLVLAFVSPTIEAFFLWQAGVTLLQVAVTAVAAWRALAGPHRPQFRRAIFHDEWRFAASVSANAIIGVFLTQSDKVLLSALMPLSQLGYYTLAGTVAAALWWIISPLNAALFPRFTQLVELGDESGTRALYHTASQLVSVMILPVALTLAFFARPIIQLWTHNAETAAFTAPVATLLVLGTCLNGLVSVPGYFQSAAGWPQLMMWTNLTGAIVLVPALLVAVPRFGGVGAASVWLILNLGYAICMIPAMHRRLLRGEMWRWYRDDVLAPLAAVGIVACGARLLLPDRGAITLVLFLAAAFACMALAALAAAPRPRAIVLRTLRRTFST